ncbi:MAG TPA: hypothetical protein VGL53_15240, partial [Bryobacteraceae bacterium]
MKHFALLLLALSMASAQVFVNNQAARAVIGQSTFTAGDVPYPSTLPDLYNPGIGQWQLGGAAGVTYYNGMLFVADSNNIGATPSNNRVLIYYNSSQVAPPANASIPVELGILCPVCTGVYGYQYGKAGTVLGQTDFVGNTSAIALGYIPATTASELFTPTQVATDGTHLAVADSQNNRVLIWNHIPPPGDNNAPADVVLGSTSFTTVVYGNIVNSSSLLGPQGVWIQNGKLYVADTRHHRIMVWNSIPTTNNAPADLVIGQPNFTTTTEQFIGQAPVKPAANNMLNPVSVTSDGTRLFVADLGQNRVLIWNTIPTQMDQPADVELGEPDMITNGYDPVTQAYITNTLVCQNSGQDPNQNNTVVYPAQCAKTLQLPRYALSDGTRLYVADGGSDRVLIWNTIPTVNDAPADIVLGQPDMLSDVISDDSGFFTPNLGEGAPNTTRTPTGLAWDGTNLYVATPYDRRIMVFTPGTGNIDPSTGVNNAASLKVFALGVVTFGGTITAGDQVQLVIENNFDTNTETTYAYTVSASDTLVTVAQNLANIINNNNDPYVIVRPGSTSVTSGGTTVVTVTLLVIARQSGVNGNNITVTPTVTNTSGSGANPTLTASGGTPSGGGSADTVAPGSLIEIDGSYLSDQTAGTLPDQYILAGSGPNGLPTDLGGVEVYVDGNRLPIYYVSPTKIVAQLPYKLSNTNASSLYVRTVLEDGTVYVSTAVGLPIAQQNPGIFATGTQEPRQAVAVHGSSYATASILIDGITTVGDLITVTIDDRVYTYTAIADDTNTQVENAFIQMINANPNERVTAAPAGQFTRIRLFAKVAGPAGEGIAVAATSTISATSPTGNTVSGVTMNVTRADLCCANVEGAPVTLDNPAEAGETIKIFATGLGAIQDLTGIQLTATEGVPYNGPALNQPLQSVSSLAGGLTANTYSASLKPGFIGIYEVVLELNASLPTDLQTQLTIAQYI